MAAGLYQWQVTKNNMSNHGNNYNSSNTWHKFIGKIDFKIKIS